MLEALKDKNVSRILSPRSSDTDWRPELERLLAKDAKLTRRNARESAIQALQRLIAFLGYSTGSGGGFGIDGDFGRGTNRGVAQFQFEHGLNKKLTRGTLCYDCSFSTARQNIVAIPETRLDVKSIEAMLTAATSAMETGDLTFGRFSDAIWHLNKLHARGLLDCGGVHAKYRKLAERAVGRLHDEEGVTVQPEWILSIIRQETGGVVRPRFEQHYLTRLARKNPGADLGELRYQSMSLGLGQIMGTNYKKVGAPSARALMTSKAADQVLFVGRFLVDLESAVKKQNPTLADFKAVARHYNGPAYEKHHYHERLQSWFQEFRHLSAS